MITNGDFQKNSCTSLTAPCIFDKTTFVQTDVPGWKPNPKIEVGLAKFFNLNWPDQTTNFVAELDPNPNTCIKQKLILRKGTYTLTFDWAAQKDQPLATSKVNVKVNGETIARLPAATDYKIQKASILFVIR